MELSLQVYGLASVALMGLGMVGVFAAHHVVRKVLAINIAGAGVFLLLVTMASRREDGTTDPVPHAMVLTGIVVAVSATALALALARRVSAAGADEPTDVGEDTHA